MEWVYYNAHIKNHEFDYIKFVCNWIEKILNVHTLKRHNISRYRVADYRNLFETIDSYIIIGKQLCSAPCMRMVKHC